MNLQQRRHDCLKLLDPSFKVVINAVRLNTHNTKSHELAKCKKAYELIADGKEIITEAIFKNKRRADILILDTFQVVEILETESEKEVLEKTSNYPFELDILYFTADEVLKDA